jgi:DNA polymerase III gamma/tau subunit
MKYLYLSLVDVLRDAAVWKFTEDDRLLFRHSPSSLSRVKELCALRSREEWMFLLDIAFRSEKDVLGTEFPRLGFELLLLRLVNAPGLLDVVGMAEDSGPPKGPSQTTFARRPMPAPASAQAGAPPRHPSPAASPGAEVRKGREGDLWDALLKNLGAKKKTVLLLGLLSQMKGRREGDELVIASPHQFVLDRLREEDKWPVLLQAVAEVAGKKLEVRLVVSGEKKSPEAGGAVGKEEDRPEKRALSDPLLTEVLREFEGATILEVRPAPGGAPIPGAAGAGEPVLDESGEDEGEGR